MALTDASGNVTQSYGYRPFGELTNSPTDSNPFQFTGRENDGTGLMYHRARYYAPEWGRFISEDPTGFQGGINAYVYAENNPVNGRDSSGQALDTLIDAVSFTISLVEFARDPSWGTFAGLVVDGAGLLAPGMPSPGAFRRLKKLADLMADAPTMPKCFPAGTMIQTRNGRVPIEQIKAGDVVLSADERTGKQSYQKVVQTFRREADALLTIVTADGRSIECTPEHPFWVKGKGFVEARHLARSDLLADVQGRIVAVSGISFAERKVTVYNFEVANTHTYYANGWWVHNLCKPRWEDIRIPQDRMEHILREHGFNTAADNKTRWEQGTTAADIWRYAEEAYNKGNWQEVNGQWHVTVDVGDYIGYQSRDVGTGPLSEIMWYVNEDGYVPSMFPYQ
jgi:RHS repeat-associated protein